MTRDNDLLVEAKINFKVKKDCVYVLDTTPRGVLLSLYEEGVISILVFRVSS